jgi:hypothetical protein
LELLPRPIGLSERSWGFFRAFPGRLNRQEVIELSALREPPREPPFREPTRREPPYREPPLWIAVAAIVFAVAGPLLLLGLSHIT